jgi:hypothetical protein
MEPALGLSGALTALRDVRPNSGGGGDMGSAARDLSSAAQGLQSVQGNIAGQTMAIQQMSMSGAQQVQSMNMVMMQLNMSIGQLVGAMSQMTSAMRVQGFQSVSQASMPPPMPFIPPAPSFGGFMGGLAAGAGDVVGSLGRMTMNAGRMGVGALTAGARGIGSLYGAAAAPFFGASYTPPELGTQFGSVGNAGMMRSLFLGSGVGAAFSRPSFQMTTAGELQRLAAERGAFKFGEIGLGAASGLAGFGLSMLGGQAGSALGGFLGGSALGGLGRLGGSLAGGIAGMGIGSLLSAPINQTMDQIGQIRAGGELFSRNAFRFLGPDQRGTMGTTSFRDRTRFGASMQSEGIEDLTFGQDEMQRIFGGMVGSDLTRGVNTAQQARQRLRQTKESIKIIGQTMAMTIEESAGLLGDLQAAGVDPSRAMRVMGGFNVSGLTRREAMGGQMAFSQSFAGTGLQGAGLMRMGAQSQQLAQTAIRMGALSPEQLAGVGGRSGAQQVLGSAMTQLMQGDFGTMMMFAGMPGGGVGSVRGGALGVMGQAGSAANPGRMAAFAANPQAFMRDAMKDPRVMSQMFSQIASAAQAIRPPGVSQRDAMALVLQGQGMNSVQADALLSMLEQSPQAMRDQTHEMQAGLNDMAISQRVESFGIFGRAGRSIQRTTRPAAQGISGFVAGAQDTVMNMTMDARDRILGIENVTVAAQDVNAATMRALRAAPMDEGRRSIAGARVSPDTQKEADNLVRYVSSSIGGLDQHPDAVSLRSETDPDKKREYAISLLNAASGGEYDSASPEKKKAIELATSKAFGGDLSSIMNSSPAAGLSSSQKKDLGSARDDIRRIVGGGSAASGLSVGSAAGAVIGFLAPVPGGAALGAAIGGGYGASTGNLSGMSASQVSALSRNKDFRSLVVAERKRRQDLAALQEKEKRTFTSDDYRKLQSGTASPELRRRYADMQKERARITKEFMTVAGSEGVTSNVPTDVMKNLNSGGLSNEDIEALYKATGVAGQLGGLEGASFATEKGFALASGAARAAGLTDLAGTLAAGGGGISEAMKQLQGLSEKDRIALLGQGPTGEALLKAGQLRAGMSAEEVRAKFGEGVASLLGTDKAVTDENLASVQQGVIAQGGGGAGTFVRGEGFTEAQMQAQNETIALLNQTAQSVTEMAQVVKQLQGKQ